MKVVLFCGGQGMRLRGYSEDVPKPMVTIGSRPVLWHQRRRQERKLRPCLGQRLFDGKEPRHDAGGIGIHRRHAFAEGDRSDRRCGIGANPGKFPQRCGIAREDAA